MFKKILNFIASLIGNIFLFFGLILLLAITSPLWAPVFVIVLFLMGIFLLAIFSVAITIVTTFWWLIIPLLLIYFGVKLIGELE
jgi:hypothetical protein